MPSSNAFKDTPRKSVVVALLSVFLFFTTIGFANDIIVLGRQQSIAFALNVILSGLFSVFYAVAGISLKGKWWKGVLPIFAVQFAVMNLLANKFPNLPQPASMTAAGLEQLRFRLTLDSLAIVVAVALGYAGSVYVSVQEARRYVKTRTENLLFESEMAAARQVQQVILPDSGQSFPGFAVASAYKPARELGGDFFQILEVNHAVKGAAQNGGLLLVVGDVAGKGLPAAMLVALIVGTIRATAEQTHDPADLLGKLHDRILGHTADGFATALAAFITGDGSVDLANAGHLPPYLDGREIELPGALPLGISGGGRYEVRKAQFKPGSRLTFLSDGVVEARNEKGELFGFDRAQAISAEPAAAILDAAVRFGQADDITVVTIERRREQRS
jgi:phosphoserine phosphatase RsbU/P